MNNTKKLILIDMIFEGSRAFIGATIIVYLMSKGMTLSDIATLKIFQSSVIVFGEVPTGVIADLLGPKCSLLVSIIMAIIAYCLYSAGDSLFYFATAEVFSALCLCFWSGAYEAFVITEGHLDRDEKKMSLFFNLNSSLNSLSIILGGFCGAFIGDINTNFPFYLAIVGLISLYIYLSCVFKKDSRKPVKFNLSKIYETMKTNLSDALYFGIKSKETRNYFATMIFLQFLMIPVLFYWQPFFKSFSDTSLKDLGFVHMLFNISIFLAGVLIIKTRIKNFLQMKETLFISFVLLSASLFLLSNSSSFLQALGIFCILEIIFIFTSNSIKTSINFRINNESRATVLSALGMFSRVGSIISLSVFKFFCSNSTDSGTIKELMNLNALIILALCVIIFPIVLFKTKVRKNEIHP